MDLETIVSQHGQRLDTLEGCVEEVGNAVLGTRRSSFAGGDRGEDGLTHYAAANSVKVDDIIRRLGGVEAHLSNGGIRVSIPPALLTAIGIIAAALIGGVATILAKVLGG